MPTTFNFTYDPGTSLQQMIGFEMAGRIWSSYLTDNVSLNIHVGVSSHLGGNVIGGALPGINASQSYLDLKTKLAADATSADDQLAINNLNARAGKKEDWKASFDLFDGKGNNSGSSAITRTLNTTRANAKALGINLLDGATALDGYILISNLSQTSVAWNYDYSRSQAPGQTLDFLGTALHEIAHVLGFVSGIDKPGWLSSSSTDKNVQNAYKNSLTQRLSYANPLDLFRYSNNTLGSNFNDLSLGSQGGNKYFSIDGKTVVAEFSTGADTGLGGDGQQASHWKPGAGLMSPTLALGQRQFITNLDLRALDVIGWNRATGSINVDLSALQTQIQQDLLLRAGLLVRDRTADIKTMIQNSQIYKLGDEEGDPFWQRVANLFHEEGVFSTLDELAMPTDLGTINQTGSTEFTGNLSICWGEGNDGPFPDLQQAIQLQQNLLALDHSVSPLFSQAANRGLSLSKDYLAQAIRHTAHLGVVQNGDGEFSSQPYSVAQSPFRMGDAFMAKLQGNDYRHSDSKKVSLLEIQIDDPSIATQPRIGHKTQM